MEESFGNRKQSDGQLALYRLLRLQNRQNNFYFHDHHHGQFSISKVELFLQEFFNFYFQPSFSQFRVHFRVSYQHFPLQTIDHNDLLKTFWKFITTHYFKKIDQEEILRLNYLRTVFQKYQNTTLEPPAIFNHLKQRFRAFWAFLQQILSPHTLATLSNKTKLNLEDIVWLKKMYVQWCSFEQSKEKKSKKISKIKRLKFPLTKVQCNKKQKKSQFKAEEEELDNIISEIESQMQVQDGSSTQMDNIDDQIQRLQKILESQADENITLVNQIQARIIEQEEQQQIHEQHMKSGQDARCLQWLIHNLQEKQIAQSVSKITSCQKKEGELKFLIEYENALNLTPTYLKESALKKMNLLRQTSLLKFYRTGVKSLHSYISHNFSGFLDLCNNRMALSKTKDKDYIQIMKKNNSLPIQLKHQFYHYEICHHCKFIYPPYMLATCRFRSDKQSMPKISEAETDFGAEISLQRARVSQRFVTKHRNCMTGYAWIDQEYVCGRKYCFSCLKDNYGRDWMKLNNGICPFCEGICSCTRCMRNQKMNKLKAFFISLGGDINSLQANGLIEKLPVRKEQFISKIKTKNMFYPQKTQARPKIKKIKKANPKRKIVLAKPQLKTSQRCKNRDGDRSNTILQEETQRWSSTAEKQLQNNASISRRMLSRRKRTYVF